MKIQSVLIKWLMLSTLWPLASVADEQADALESNSPTWVQLDPAWTGVSNKIIDFVGEDKQKLLADLAYAAVAGDLCQDLKLDRTKFQAAFDDGFSNNIPTTNIAAYGQKVSMYFGVYIGLLTADGMMERDNFCDAAYKMMADGEGRYWLANSGAKTGQ